MWCKHTYTENMFWHKHQLKENINSHLALQEIQRGNVEKWEFLFLYFSAFCYRQKELPPPPCVTSCLLVLYALLWKTLKDKASGRAQPLPIHSWGHVTIQGLWQSFWCMGSSSRGHPPPVHRSGCHEDARSLILSAPTLWSQTPALLPIETGDHSSWVQAAPSSPRIPSVTCYVTAGICRQGWRTVVGRCAMATWLQNLVANGSGAQNQSLEGCDLLFDSAFQTLTSVLKISCSVESIIYQK